MPQDTLIITVIALIIVVGSCVALCRAGRKQSKNDNVEQE